MDHVNLSGVSCSREQLCGEFRRRQNITRGLGQYQRHAQSHEAEFACLQHANVLSWCGGQREVHFCRYRTMMVRARRGLDLVIVGSMALIAMPATPPSNHHEADSDRRRTGPSGRYRPLAHPRAAIPVGHSASAHPPSVSTIIGLQHRRQYQGTIDRGDSVPGNVSGFRQQECCAVVSSVQC